MTRLNRLFGLSTLALLFGTAALFYSTVMAAAPGDEDEIQHLRERSRILQLAESGLIQIHPKTPSSDVSNPPATADEQSADDSAAGAAASGAAEKEIQQLRERSRILQMVESGLIQIHPKSRASAVSESESSRILELQSKLDQAYAEILYLKALLQLFQESERKLGQRDTRPNPEVTNTSDEAQLAAIRAEEAQATVAAGLDDIPSDAVSAEYERANREASLWRNQWSSP